MLTIEEMKSYLKANLKEKRYAHILGVADTAKKLAQINGVSEEKAEIAGLVHDIAKNLSKEKMQEIIKGNNLVLSEVEKNNSDLWHSIIGPIVAKEKLEIEDEEILSAMRWHTTGKKNMSTLEKILYIADMIEPGRNFEGVEEIREATFNDLDRGVFLGLTHSIKFLLTKDLLIDINTIESRNHFLFK